MDEALGGELGLQGDVSRWCFALTTVLTPNTVRRPLAANLSCICCLSRALKHSEAWSIVRSCKVLGYTTGHSYIVTLIPNFSLQDVCYLSSHQKCLLFLSEGPAKGKSTTLLYTPLVGDCNGASSGSDKGRFKSSLNITIILHYASLTKRFVKRVH